MYGWGRSPVGQIPGRPLGGGRGDAQCESFLEHGPVCPFASDAAPHACYGIDDLDELFLYNTQA